MILINSGKNQQNSGGFYLCHENRKYTLRLIHSNRMEKAGVLKNKREHRHSVYHIIVIQRGRGSFLLDHKVISVFPGTSMFISPGQRHCLGVNEGENICYGEVTFEFLDGDENQLSLNFSDILSIMSGKDVFVPSLTGLSDFDPYKEIDPFLTEISELRFFQGIDPLFHISSTSVLLRLLTSLTSFFSDSNQIKSHLSAIEKIHFYIAENYQLPLTLNDLSQVGSLSEKYLSRRFKDRYGETPIYFRDSLRIESACELLRGSNYSVGDIAGKCGFFDIYYFSKIFKKRMGKSPGEYRKFH